MAERNEFYRFESNKEDWDVIMTGDNELEDIDRKINELLNTIVDLKKIFLLPKDPSQLSNAMMGIKYYLRNLELLLEAKALRLMK